MFTRGFNKNPCKESGTTETVCLSKKRTSECLEELRVHAGPASVWSPVRSNNTTVHSFSSVGQRPFSSEVGPALWHHQHWQVVPVHSYKSSPPRLRVSSTSDDGDLITGVESREVLFQLIILGHTVD